MEPEHLTFQLLQEFTNDFADEHKVGEGAYGVVYKGVTKNGDDVAVKKLRDNLVFDETQFRNEFHNLKMLTHQNIVQFLGYCYETKQLPIKCNGRALLAETRYRALCFEYLHKGCLNKYLSDEFRGLDWNTRYKIIKGTCQGLKYIHEELDKPLYHLDLKPDNILLDKDMVPKIADFGLSRIFCKRLTQTAPGQVGTLGYQPPEHIEKGEISEKFDIFSLGVIIIKIVSGPEGYSKCAYTSNNEFIDLVKTNWRSRLQATWSGSSLDAYCDQVERCTEIALSCVEHDSHERPSIANIIDRLSETETEIGKSVLLQVEPLQLHFPFEQDNLMVSCSLQLTNNTDNQVVFRLVTKNPEYFLGPLCGVVASRCRYTLAVTRRDKLLNPSMNRDEYFTLESSKASDHEIQYEISNDMESYNHFFLEAKENGRDMHKVKLTAIYGPPELGKTTNKICQKACSLIVSEITMDDKYFPNQRQHFNLMASNGLHFVDIRETSSDVEELIVGRAEEKKRITSFLESMTEEVIILPIYGIGGIGKTTFAKLIYNYFKHYSRAWVHVSPRFDFNKICNTIISQLSEKESQTNETDVIHSCLTKLLSGKKILIVLDDLWEDNRFQLEDLRNMLHLGENRKTIVLVTTRSKQIAENICSNHNPYKIESLTSDMCWDIIKQRSGFEARYDKEHLMIIGREIALKCGGVALAAQSLGFMLQSMTSDQWVKVKDSDIWNESVSKDASSPNNVLASLKLSYHSMPPYMKLCFAYCALFPKGHKIVKDDLIFQWISLGFIKPTKLLSTMQLCEEYIVKLLGLSFLKHSVSFTTIGEYDKGVTLFTMHDLVHDLAKLVMGDKLITDELRGLYAFLTDSRKSLESSTNYYPDKIRALHFLDFGYIELDYKTFSFAKSLRVLDLSECSKFLRLPASLGELVQLRYLNAPNTEWVADCFTELSKLIYLNLSGFQMDKLPRSIGTVEGLIYLDISNCPQIVSLPESFVNLKKLVHLDCSNCTHFVFHHQGSVDVCNVLTNLQYLNVSRQRGCWYISPFASALHMVQKTIGSFSKLRYLNLSYALSSTLLSEIAETFSFIDCICTLSTLEHLDLSHNYNIVNVPESIGSLRKLHTLNLSFCIRLLRLPECMVRMYSLRNLNVTGCSNLDKSTFSRSKIVVLFPHFVVHTNDDESSSNIGLLRDANPEELHISRLDNVKSAAEVKSIELIEKQRIEDLKLEWTKDDFRSVEDVEVLDDLVPPSSVRKFDLKGYNSVGFPPWVMDMKLYLPNLIKIVLCDLCKCNSLPPLGQLPKLQEVVMEGMDSITAIDEGFCGVERAFPVLKKFHIHRMENLETWNTKYSYDKGGVKKFMFPNLEEVSIGDCPKLRLKPCPPRAKRWGIENANDVLGSRFATTNILQVIFKKLSTWGTWGETCSSYSAAPYNATLRVKSSKLPLRDWRLLHHLPPISELRIIGCNDLTCSSLKITQYLPWIESLWLEDIFDPELPKWLGGLISLRELIIRRCAELNGLQQSMQQLTSLQLLCLNGCPSITKIPEWLGTLSSLKELVIWDCTGIKSLPTSILPQLELLYIYYCPELVDWCEQEENKHKLAHIENQVYAVSHSPGTWYHEEFRVPANGVTDTCVESWWDQGSCGSAAEFDWPEDGVTDTCGESSCDQGSCGSAAELIREAALPEDGVTDTIDGSLCDQGSSRSAAELTTQVQGTRHGRAATRGCSATSGCSEYTDTLQVDEPAVEEGCGVHSAGSQARPEVRAVQAQASASEE